MSHAWPDLLRVLWVLRQRVSSVRVRAVHRLPAVAFFPSPRMRVIAVGLLVFGARRVRVALP